MRVLSLGALLRLVLTILALVLTLVASALLHLRTDLGKAVGRDLLNVYVSQLIAGRLHAERIEELGLDRILVRNVSLYDPNGTRVIFGEEITLKIDPLAALDGTLRFSHARLVRGRLRLEEDAATGQPTFLSALAAADQSPSTGEPFHAIVDDMHLEEVRAYGELLGLSGIYADHVRAHGRMEFHHYTVIRVYSGSGTVRAPFEYTGQLDNIVATVNTNDHIGTDLYVRAHTGADRARVAMHYGLPANLYAGADTPLELDLRVYAEPVHGETLAQSGFEWASILRGEIRGMVRLHGPPDRLELEGRLRTEGGFVEVSGALPSEGEVVVRAESHALDLAGLVDGAPEAMIDGGIALRVPEGEGEATFEAHAEPFRYATYAVPALTATGRLLDDAVVLDALRGSDEGGAVEGEGTVGFDGSYDLRLRGSLQESHAEPNLATMAPELRGAVDFRARVRGAGERTEVDGTASFRRFRYDPVSASGLTASGRVAIDEGMPALDLRITGREVRVAGLPIGSGTAHIGGDAGRYRFTGSLREASGRESRFESQLRIVGDTIMAEVPTLVLSRGGQTWSGSATGVRLDDRTIDVEDIRMTNGRQSATASVQLHDGAPDEIDVHLDAISLPDLRAFLGPMIPPSDGEADLALAVRGEADVAPSITLTGELRDITLLDVPRSSASYSLVLERGEAELDGSVTLADQGSLRVGGTAIVEGGLFDLDQAFRDGVYELALDADGVALSVLDRAAGGGVPEGTTGHLSGHFDVEGPIAAPTFRGSLSIPDLRVPGWPDMSLRLASRYEYGSISANATLADPHGTLLEGEGSVMMDLVYAVQNPDAAISALDTSPWRFSLRVPPRSMGEVPLPIREGIPFDPSDFRLGGSLTLAGGAFRTRGNLLASLDYVPTGDSQALCGAASEPRATLVAELGEGRTDATLHGVIEGSRVLTVTATAATPLDAWLRAADVPEIPPVRVEATIDQAPADAMPLVCEWLAGDLAASVVMEDLFGAAPTVMGEISSERLRWRRLERSVLTRGASAVVETQPIQIRLGFAADGNALTLDSDMQWWNGGQTQATANLASTWEPRALFPTVADDAAVEAAVHFFRMPLEAAVAWVPGLANIDGLVEGHATMHGTLAEPHIDGALDVEDGQLDLRTLGQRLREVRGHAVLTDDGILLQGFTASDDRGVATIDGTVELEGLSLARSTLALRARSFPIRNEGSVMARLTGNAELANRFVDGGTEGEMRIDTLAVELPESSGRSPQGLAAHPEICVRRAVPGAAAPVCGGSPQASADAYDVRIDVASTRPFWVRSADFEALVTADLNVLYSDELYVGGVAEIRRGHFEVFGKRFDVQSGGLGFDQSSAELNPRVELVATHRIRNDPNRTVTIVASGTLANPVIEFSSTVPTANEGEIIALLITGTTHQRRETANTSTQAAGEEAADFLAGVAFGVASLSLREEFGEHFPVINVETADGGFSSARIRAGYNIDDVIPERMRSVVQGVYIEGYFTARGQQDPGASAGGATSTGTGQDAGFLIELQFPHNIVGTGTYAPPSNWGVDITWEP